MRMTPLLWQKAKGTKELLDEGKRGEAKGWLKNEHSKNEDHGIWPHYFITNRWETIETVRDFLFLGAKITADGDCSDEIKRCFLLGRKAMINLDSTLKSRDISLPTKVRLIKAIVSPVVMDGCESWTIKEVEHRRTDAFELVLEKTLESPLNWKEIKPVNPK